MRSDVFMRLIATQDLNKVYRYRDDAHGVMLYITRRIRGEKIYYDVDYGTHIWDRINTWLKPELSDGIVYAGYSPGIAIGQDCYEYAGYHPTDANGRIMKDCYLLDVTSLIPVGCPGTSPREDN